MNTPAFRLSTALIEMENLCILGLGLHDPMPGGIVHRPHGLGHYCIAFFHSDTIIRLHDVDYGVPPQRLIIWEPEACQYFGNAKAPWEYSWVSCDGSFVQASLDTLAIPRNHVLSLRDPYSIDCLLRELHRECTQYLHPSPTMVRNLFHNGLLEIQRQLAPAELFQPFPSWASAAIQYMDLHLAQPITLAQLAEQTHLSIPHFCRKFHDIFGMPPMAYLTNLRMQMAKYLLLDDNLSIGEIAGRIGYDNFSYFSLLFKRYYGVTPRDMRKDFSGEAGRKQRAKERRSRDLAYWLREGWQVMLDYDFAQTTRMDARLHSFWSDDFGTQRPTPFPAHCENGCLRLPAYSVWVGLRWESELGEEIKLEVIAANSSSDGLNLALALSGDIQQGYRLRFSNYDYVALETTLNGSWEILRRCPLTLNPHADAYHITFWRSDNVFYAELDGQRILEFPEPFAPRGPLHRQFALARFHEYGSADLRMLRVFTRIAPRYVDILEPGRAFLHAGYREDAYTWFMQVAEGHSATAIVYEALYLAALAVPEDDRAAKEQAFHRATADTAGPFYRRMLRQWALTRLEWEDINGAVELALGLAQLDPSDDTPQLLAEKLITHMHRMAPADFSHALHTLARLPLTSLRLIDLPLSTLAPLQGMPLQELTCGSALLSDLTPLHGMQLERLYLQQQRGVGSLPIGQHAVDGVDLCRESDS